MHNEEFDISQIRLDKMKGKNVFTQKEINELKRLITLRVNSTNKSEKKKLRDNIIFLIKKCPISSKGWGQVCVHTIFPAFILIFPITLLGMLCDTILSKFMGAGITFLVVTMIIAVFTFALYLAVGLLRLKDIKLHFPHRKTKQND